MVGVTQHNGPQSVFMWLTVWGTQVKQDYELSSLARQVKDFVLQAGKVMGCTLFRCLCKQGYWMFYAVSHVHLIRGVENGV